MITDFSSYNVDYFTPEGRQFNNHADYMANRLRVQEQFKADVKADLHLNDEQYKALIFLVCSLGNVSIYDFSTIYSSFINLLPLLYFHESHSS